MRLLIFALLVLPSLATAQTTDQPSANSRWHLSLSVFPGFDRSDFFTTYVTAADTVARQPRTIAGRTLLPRREADTLQLGGIDEIYFSENAFASNEAAGSSLKLGFQLKAHYRFPNGLELSAGFFYQRYAISHRRADAALLPAGAFYSVRTLRSTRAGISWAGSYHFLRTRRIQPYLGLRGFSLISHSRISNSQLVSPDRPEVFDRPITPRFANNTIFDFEMEVFAGLSYQFSSRVNVGLEARIPLSGIPIPEPSNLIVRYRLGRNSTAL